MTNRGNVVTEPVIPLRPHHVLCSLGFVGKGYSDAFTANMTTLVEGRLRAPDGGNQIVEIVGEADAICAPCPKRIGTGCTSADRIEILDTRHAEALDLKPGDTMRWGDAIQRVREKIAPDDLDHLCEGCQWLPQGMCKSAIRLLGEASSGP